MDLHFKVNWHLLTGAEQNCAQKTAPITAKQYIYIDIFSFYHKMQLLWAVSGLNR